MEINSLTPSYVTVDLSDLSEKDRAKALKALAVINEGKFPRISNSRDLHEALFFYSLSSIIESLKKMAEIRKLADKKKQKSKEDEMMQQQRKPLAQPAQHILPPYSK